MDGWMELGLGREVSTNCINCIMLFPLLWWTEGMHISLDVDAAIHTGKTMGMGMEMGMGWMFRRYWVKSSLFLFNCLASGRVRQYIMFSTARVSGYIHTVQYSYK